MTWGSNVFPLLIVTSSGGFTGLFVYSPAPGAGNLIASTAAQPGTDPYGNAYLSGEAVYGTIAGTSYAIQLGWTSGIGSSVPLIGFYTAATPAGPYTRQSFISIDNSGNFIVTSPANVQFGVGSGGGTFLGGYTDLANVTAPGSVSGHARPFATGGNLAVVNGLTGDGQTYDTQVLHIRTYPAQLISLNSFSNVTGASVLVGAAHYTFVCRILYTTAAAAGASQFQFTSPATTGNLSLMGDWFPTGGGAPTNVSRNTTSSLSLAAGATLNGTGGNVTLEGDVTFSAAGTLQLQAQTSIAGDNYTIAAVYLDLYPVN